MRSRASRRCWRRGSRTPGWRGLASGLFLAFSYTFWSQAITAEVYTLHLLIVGAALLALLAWAEHPTVGRLALFYAIYAVGFGNHLSMVLLLPALAPFSCFVERRPERGRSPAAADDRLGRRHRRSRSAAVCVEFSRALDVAGAACCRSPKGSPSSGSTSPRPTGARRS